MAKTPSPGQAIDRQKTALGGRVFARAESEPGVQIDRRRSRRRRRFDVAAMDPEPADPARRHVGLHLLDPIRLGHRVDIDGNHTKRCLLRQRLQQNPQVVTIRLVAMEHFDTPKRIAAILRIVNLEGGDT